MAGNGTIHPCQLPTASLMDLALLTLDDIAALYKTTRTRARLIVKMPGFPQFAPGTTWRQPRWIESEVWTFIRRGRPPRVDEDAE